MFPTVAKQVRDMIDITKTKRQQVAHNICQDDLSRVYAWVVSQSEGRINDHDTNNISLRSSFCLSLDQ
jgi:hypothetical protein